MKKKKPFGIAAFAAVIVCVTVVLSLAGCDDTGTNDPGGGNDTPVADDYTFDKILQMENMVTAVTITAKPHKSPGTVRNIKYDGNVTVPQAVGNYAVTFDVAAATGWNAATGLNAGTLSIVTLISPDMVWIPGGSFKMGNTWGGGNSDETPVHTVTLTGFYMGKYEVTQALYLAVMGYNPSNYSSKPASGETQGNRPVEQISWYAAIRFCNRLSMAEGLDPAYRMSGSTDPSDWGELPTSVDATWNAVQIESEANGYRLPTEAQWEYAAKGGNDSPGDYTYSGSNTVGDVAWYSANSGPSRTHEVGKKAANGLGLHDMTGNVYEWCWDWWTGYSSEAQSDPVGPVSGTSRIIRGGNFDKPADNQRVTLRWANPPIDMHWNFGFRLLRQAAEP
jgi:formylglycine-generating enzyme required for sulfatase activity